MFESWLFLLRIAFPLAKIPEISPYKTKVNLRISISLKVFNGFERFNKKLIYFGNGAKGYCFTCFCVYPVRCRPQNTPNSNKAVINTYSMKQPDLYYFETIKMTSQA